MESGVPTWRRGLQPEPGEKFPLPSQCRDPQPAEKGGDPGCCWVPRQAGEPHGPGGGNGRRTGRGLGREGRSSGDVSLAVSGRCQRGGASIGAELQGASLAASGRLCLWAGLEGCGLGRRGGASETEPRRKWAAPSWALLWRRGLGRGRSSEEQASPQVGGAVCGRRYRGVAWEGAEPRGASFAASGRWCCGRGCAGRGLVQGAGLGVSRSSPFPGPGCPRDEAAPSGRRPGPSRRCSGPRAEQGRCGAGAATGDGAGSGRAGAAPGGRWGRVCVSGGGPGAGRGAGVQRGRGLCLRDLRMRRALSHCAACSPDPCGAAFCCSPSWRSREHRPVHRPPGTAGLR